MRGVRRIRRVHRIRRIRVGIRGLRVFKDIYIYLFYIYLFLMIKCIIGFLRTQKIEFHFISWPKKDTFRGESRDCEKVVVGGRGVRYMSATMVARRRKL